MLLESVHADDTCDDHTNRSHLSDTKAFGEKGKANHSRECRSCAAPYRIRRADFEPLECVNEDAETRDVAQRDCAHEETRHPHFLLHANELHARRSNHLEHDSRREQHPVRRPWL